ncbi:hypothetical protein GCM10011297_30710 [Bacterioplanes sanyensis]|uniref:lipocalin family protein n=1 Tax=Bacterioplanes sanyensis TaxID=1249553 RepID=UPI001674D78A|nr:lipocalin family protein [Bacterioplanes sanyensis]GGY55753.1 hypothetical protein GCM10011297_30710 [Bacterioplanes sanyensis]
MKQIIATSLLFVLLLALGGCSALQSTGMPEQVTPVRSFQLSNYLGQWYEIARLPHSFEEGLIDVTATYSLRDDGGVRVINRGFHQQDNEYQQAEGKAYFVGATDTAHLKVSFFGPFYGSYVVFWLNGQRSYVSGPSTDYLWLLSRTPRISQAELAHFKQTAREAGFDLRNLIVNPGSVRQQAGE